ncbi:hypothetical protein Q5O89_20915 [Peribacillus frigoritolerans]|nr:hypothetical protein [Peribacillus frigoritolerans]
MKEIEEQCCTKNTNYGGIIDENELLANLKSNCVPLSLFHMNANQYEEFLEERRILMSKKIQEYYEQL